MLPTASSYLRIFALDYLFGAEMPAIFHSSTEAHESDIYMIRPVSYEILSVNCLKDSILSSETRNTFLWLFNRCIFI